MSAPVDDEEFRQWVHDKRCRRMQRIDELPRDIRLLVNEYGYNVVHTLWGVGVRTSGQIRHVVEAILDEFSPTRGTCSRANVSGQKQERQG